MHGKDVLKIALVAALLLAVVIGYGQFTRVQKAKIEAERSIQVEKIEQTEKTERTEERSQFWQKLVPWGKDEIDEGKVVGATE